jgi:hypothetical protein
MSWRSEKGMRSYDMLDLTVGSGMPDWMAGYSMAHCWDHSG